MARQNRDASSKPRTVEDEALEQTEWQDVNVESIENLDADTALAIGLDETAPAEADSNDDMTPETLLGDHRGGRWASREGESDLGLDPLPGELPEK